MKKTAPSDGLNKGFSKANGRYFLFINSDDELCDNALQNIYDEIKKIQDLMYTVAQQESLIKRKIFKAHIFRQNEY